MAGAGSGASSSTPSARSSVRTYSRVRPPLTTWTRSVTRARLPSVAMRWSHWTVAAAGADERGSRTSEGLCRGESRGPDGREQARDRADRDGGAGAAGPRRRWDHDAPLLGASVDRRRQRAAGDSGRAAERREQDRLGEELRADLAGGRTEGSPQPDL